MTDDTVQVALVGYGLAGEAFHAPFLVTTPGLRVAAVVTGDPTRRARAHEYCPDAALFDHVDALWSAADDLGIGLVVLATPNRTHVPLGLAAVERGVAVVVDKPLAPDAATGRRLVDAAESADVPLSVFHNRRWDGDFLTVRRLLDEGALGDVWRFESRFERWRPQRRVATWREDPDPAAGGGVLLDLASHLVDQALVAFGPVRSVYGELGRRRAGTAVDDDAFVALEHTGGVFSHLWVSSVAARLGPRFRVLGARAGYVSHGMDGQEAALRAGVRPGDRGWGVTAEEGWGTVGSDDDHRPVPTERGDYGEFYRRMAAAVRGAGPVPVEPADAVAVLDVLDAARRSAADGVVVALGR